MKEKKLKIEEMRRRKKERAALIKRQGKSRNYKSRGNGASTTDVTAKIQNTDEGDHASSKVEVSAPNDESMDIDVEGTGTTTKGVMSATSNEQQPDKQAENVQDEEIDEDDKTQGDKDADGCDDEAIERDGDETDGTDSGDNTDDGVEHESDQKDQNDDVFHIDHWHRHASVQIPKACA